MTKEEYLRILCDEKGIKVPKIMHLINSLEFVINTPKSYQGKQLYNHPTEVQFCFISELWIESMQLQHKELGESSSYLTEDEHNILQLGTTLEQYNTFITTLKNEISGYI